MIRNKWLWTGFALLISVSFLGYFSPRSGGCGRKAFEEDRKAGAQGRLFDRNVSRDEFANAQFFEMGMRERTLTPSDKERLHKRTWQRLVALRVAEQMGIRTSAEEVLAAVTRDPSFSANGVFSKTQYKAVVRAQLGVDVAMYETYLTQELTMQKLLGMLESVLLTAPGELQRRLSSLTDVFAAEYTVLTTHSVKTEVKLSPEDVDKFYEEHKRLFTEPAKVRVKYVSFPITNYLAGITIPESDMKEYYEVYDEEFMAHDTNDPAARLPFEQVTNTIAARLLHHEAEKKAKNAATDFVLRLADRLDASLTFDQAASTGRLAVSTTELFSIQSELPGIDAGADFNRAAFDLDPADRSRSFSDAVVGSNTVYALSFLDRIDERIPLLAEVKERATALARRDAEDTAFLAKCRDIRGTIRKEMDNGKAFSSAVTAAGFNVSTTESFSVYGGLTNEAETAYAEQIVRGVIYMSPGELSDPLPSTNGVVILHLTDRQGGDPAAMLMLKPQMQAAIERSSVSVLFHDWENHLLSQAGFEDYMPLRTAEEEEAKPEQDRPEPINPIEP
jgi:hypothetical protein